MTPDSEENGKHSPNVISVEDYVNKRMNKIPTGDPPPGYGVSPSVAGKASPRMFDGSKVIPSASEAAARQLGLHTGVHCLTSLAFVLPHAGEKYR